MRQIEETELDELQDNAYDKGFSDGKQNPNLTPDDLEFIKDALSFYFHDAHNNLERKTIGDIEKKNYEWQLDKAKELIKKLDR